MEIKAASRFPSWLLGQFCLQVWIPVWVPSLFWPDKGLQPVSWNKPCCLFPSCFWSVFCYSSREANTDKCQLCGISNNVLSYPSLVLWVLWLPVTEVFLVFTLSISQILNIISCRVSLFKKKYLLIFLRAHSIPGTWKLCLRFPCDASSQYGENPTRCSAKDQPVSFPHSCIDPVKTEMCFREEDQMYCLLYLSFKSLCWKQQQSRSLEGSCGHEC